MTIHHESHADRIAAGIGFEWDLLPPRTSSMAEVDGNVEELHVARVRKSHRGIGSLRRLRRLWAHAVDQDFLDEICQLESLEMLCAQSVTASDLTGLASLPQLRRLVVKDAPKAEDLEWLRSMRSLEALGLENLKRVGELEPLASLTRLRSLGVEGSLWTPMRVRSLEPLQGLRQLEFLFLTNLRVQDKSLQPLLALPDLRVLQCARFYPASEFMALAIARPSLKCHWLRQPA